MEAPRLYDAREAGALFGVEGVTFTRWVNAGKVPKEAFFITPGGSRRYRADFIDQMVREHTERISHYR
jgi:predicted site-specific integrase-resolvase